MSSLTGRKLSEMCAEINLRTDEIINLATSGVDYAACDGLRDFLEYITEDDAKELPELPFLAEMAEAEDDPDIEDFLSRIYTAGTFGFLIQAGTPVYEKIGNGASYSWGHYSTRWFYGETFEVAIGKAADWARAEYRAAMSGEAA